MTGSTRLLTVLVTAFVALGAVTGAAAAASHDQMMTTDHDASASASPSTAGATATHTVTLTVGENAAGSLDGIAVNYSDTGANASGVGVENVMTVGVDRGDDADGATIDVDASDDLSDANVSNDGGMVTLGFGGNYSVGAGDEVVVAYDGVMNPEASGNYTVGVDISPEVSGATGDASLSIDSETNESTTTADDTMGTETNESTTTADDTMSTETNESMTTADDGTAATDSTGPGFGLVVALAALVGAALVLLRRN